jgi:hypothetical protein
MAMDVFGPRHLRSLSERAGEPCASIFLPTHRAGPDVEQDRIRLKGLLQDAAEQLSALGLRRPHVRERLEPAERLFGDAMFWRHLSDGLAVFLGADWHLLLRLPIAFGELVVVADRPAIKPLLPYLGADGRFFVLALSQNRVRLLEGTRHAVDEVALPGVPSSLEEAMRFDDPEKQLQHRAADRGGADARAVFHGHGGGERFDKDRILRFFQQVDRGIAGILGDERAAPMLLAGVDYLLPIYREASDHPNLLDGGVTGNPDRVSAEDLHAVAWQQVEPVFLEARRRALERFAELDGTGKTMRDVADVLHAAEHGRVEELFVASDAIVWGRLLDGDLETRDEPQPGDEDLLDLGAVRVLTTGGRVHPLPADHVPGGGPLAAVLRY